MYLATHDPAEDARSAMQLFLKYRTTSPQHILACQEVLARSPRTANFAEVGANPVWYCRVSVIGTQ